VTKSPLVIAVDAGGTSTRCLLASAEGEVRGQARSGPGNHILSGWEPTRRAITDAVTGACEAAEVDAAGVACVFAGSAGVGPNGEGREIVEALLASLAPHACVHAVGDMVTAFTGALRGEVGVVVAAGTGAVAYGRNARGDSRQVGGWGPVMGDEGSAYDIAVRGLRAAARATDGRGPTTELVRRLPAALGVETVIEVAFRLYAEPIDREAVARLAMTVAEAAAAGDEIARALLGDAGVELALAGRTALRLLGLADAAVPVAYTGSVFTAGDCLLDRFRRAITDSCPRSAVVPADFPPVVGAYKLGLRALGLAFTAQSEAALRQGLVDGPASRLCTV
jgi:N-acetylglucosamine kinase-like BadF-type ATPase